MAAATASMRAAADDPVLMALMSTGGLIEPTESSPGSLDLNFFTANSTAFDYLENFEFVTLACTLEIDDQHGGVATQTAIVTIHNDFFGV